MTITVGTYKITGAEELESMLCRTPSGAVIAGTLSDTGLRALAAALTEMDAELESARYCDMRTLTGDKATRVLLRAIHYQDTVRREYHAARDAQTVAKLALETAQHASDAAQLALEAAKLQKKPL